MISLINGCDCSFSPEPEVHYALRVCMCVRVGVVSDCHVSLRSPLSHTARNSVLLPANINKKEKKPACGLITLFVALPACRSNRWVNTWKETARNYGELHAIMRHPGSAARGRQLDGSRTHV